MNLDYLITEEGPEYPRTCKKRERTLNRKEKSKRNTGSRELDRKIRKEGASSRKPFEDGKDDAFP